MTKNKRTYNNQKNKSRKPSSKRKVKVDCKSIDKQGKGIVKIDNKHVSVPHLIEGEKAIVEVSKKGKYKTTKVHSIKKESQDREEPKCPHYYECGGCQLQHMKYEAQTKFKEKTVRGLLGKYGKINDIITMDDPYNYRNKIHSTLSTGKKGKIVSGIYESHSHKVVPIERCIIQDPKADKIISTIRKQMKICKIRPYDEDTGNGFLRHILIKTGYSSGEVMVVLVVASKMFHSRNKFIKGLLKEHPEITTIVMNINNRRTSVVLGNIEKVLYGKGYIEDKLCGYTFQISPKSFYQVNPIQTEKLYNKAMDMAKLDKNEIAFDAYSGIGTIGLIVSDKVKKVIGVELNRDAVKDAIKNSKRNNVKNARFYQGDAGEFMVKMAENKQEVDTLFMDPPRSGSDEKFLQAIYKLGPKKVIYISCNPITQERDLQYLTKRGYTVEEIQPVDMFPHTYHVEVITLLTKKDKA